MSEEDISGVSSATVVQDVPIETIVGKPARRGLTRKQRGVIALVVLLLFAGIVVRIYTSKVFVNGLAFSDFIKSHNLTTMNCTGVSSNSGVYGDITNICADYNSTLHCINLNYTLTDISGGTCIPYNPNSTTGGFGSAP